MSPTIDLVIRMRPRRAIAGLGLSALFLLFALNAGAATLTVTTLDDNTDEDAACSLREAVRNAVDDTQNHDDCAAGTGDDVIEFDSGLFSGTPAEATIALTAELAIGQLDGPTGALSILPPPDHRIILQGSGTDTVMSLRARVTPFLLQDAEIRGGRSTFRGGGVIVNSPNVRFVRVRFIDNIADSNGGAIYRNQTQAGVLRIEHCHFENNASTGGSGGAVYMRNGEDYDITISDSVFINNTSHFAGGAASVTVTALSNPGTPSLDITSSRFEDNTAGGDGGGLAVFARDPDARIDATIVDTLFRNNHSDNKGGALNGAGDKQGSQQDLTARRNTFMGNSVGNTIGGATLGLIHMAVGLENNLFVGNESGRNGVVTVSNNGSALPRIVDLVGNSFHHNQTNSSESARTLTLSASADATGWEWRLAGNLFDPDPLVDASECVIVGGSEEELTLTGGANISPDPSCVFFPEDVEADPQVALSTTADALKPRSLLPQVGSPAIDLWPAADCNAISGAPLTDDLRGEPRPRDGDGVDGADCESGAFELPDAGLLTVGLAGTGAGTVISDPSGIDCGSTCSAGFAGGSRVTLAAAAEAGSVFVGWSGDCTGTSDCVLEIDGDMQATATFDTASSHVLDVTRIGDGGGLVNSAPSGIYCEPSCAASFADGTEITLTASSDASSAFDGWSGGGCSGTGDCVITLTADTGVSAEFTATHFPVTVDLAGTGSGSVTSDPAGIACPDDCEESFARTETVTLTATPAGGSVFSQWEGDCSGSGDCVLDMDAGPYTVTARFERLRTLSVDLSGGGSGTVTSSPAGVDCPGDCSEAYVDGTDVDLTATADLGSSFAGWSGACTGTGACSVLMDADKSVTATFQTASFTLDVTVTGSGSVTSSPAGIDCPGDCSETYLAGTEIELTPAPAAGHHFVQWSGDCGGTGACTVTMDQARSVGALFEESVDEIFADRFGSP